MGTVLYPGLELCRWLAPDGGALVLLDGGRLLRRGRTGPLTVYRERVSLEEADALAKKTGYRRYGGPVKGG